MTTPLLLLHGALANKSSLNKLVPYLNNAFEIHSLDFIGHGDVAIAENVNFSIELFSKNVIDYLNNNNIDPINVFGYSMGGYVALHLCLTHPKRIENVFTLGTKLLWTPEAAEREIKMLDADKMLQKIPAFTEELQKRHTKTNWRTMLQKTASMMIDLGNKNPLNENTLSNILHTVRIGIGDRDMMAGLEDTIRAFRLMPHAQLQVFPDTPHPLERVNIKIVADAIKDFFKD